MLCRGLTCALFASLAFWHVAVQMTAGSGSVLGMQVVANYVAMVPNGKVFDSSLEKGRPYDIRIGTGQVCNPNTVTQL